MSWRLWSKHDLWAKETFFMFTQHEAWQIRNKHIFLTALGFSISFLYVCELSISSSSRISTDQIVHYFVWALLLPSSSNWKETRKKLETWLEKWLNKHVFRKFWLNSKVLISVRNRWFEAFVMIWSPPTFELSTTVMAKPFIFVSLQNSSGTKRAFTTCTRTGTGVRKTL